MPVRGSYQIANREEGKALERDESYKSCILAMVIFILLCSILIIAGVCLKKRLSDYREHDKDIIQTAGVSGEGVAIVETNTTIDIDSQENRPFRNNQPFERYTNNASTESPDINNAEHSQITRKIDMAFEEPVQTSSTLTILNLTNSAFAKTENTETSILKEKELLSISLGIQSTEEYSTEMDTSSTFVHSSTNLSGEIEDSTTIGVTTRRLDDVYTSLQRLLVGKYFSNESTTSKIDEENWLEAVDTEVTQKPEESLSIYESTKLTTLSKTRSYSPMQSNSERDGVYPEAEKIVEITTAKTVHVRSDPKEDILRQLKINVCESGSCKQIAGKMLSYMNHSADPCEDFYEYACGGLEADRQIIEKDLNLRIHEIIARQAHKNRKETKYINFNKYHESCLKYDNKIDFDHRLKLAKEALNGVGKFYTSANWLGDFQGFTKLFANMILNNRPLLFDIIPDVDEANPDAFSLTIRPAVDNTPFHLSKTHNPCELQSEESLQDPVDLGYLYENYKSCQNDTQSMIGSIRKALKDLGIFEDPKNTSNISQYIEGTVINIDLEIIKGVLAYYPLLSEIREAYTSKQYTITTLGELEASCKLLNWTQLITLLTGLTPQPNMVLQIYYKDQLIKAIRHLEEFGKGHQLELNNALLGLYARNLYDDLIAPRYSRELEEHCLTVATYFLKNEASQLYMNSFVESELQHMKSTLEQIFHELKETLRLEIQGSEWAVEWGREVLLKKLSDIRMSLPELSYFRKKDEHELHITDNYFVNSLTLMKKYRSMIYSVVPKNPKDPEEIWTFFASPFQSTTQTIYALNIIVVPYGAIDWSTVSKSNDIHDYLTQATIGNLIAREIAHNFDTNGIRYWNGSRDSEFALMTDSDITKTTYEDYINCQRYSLYQESMEMLLPSTGQHISFKIPPLTLNSRMSDAVGMRLAHDTLARLGKTATDKRLPWLDLDVSQLFYLAYAQSYCTKAPLTSSYVSLYEDSTLPGRIRILVAASSNRLIGEAWSCPEGSQILPTFTCRVFPHLEYRTSVPDST